VVFVVGGGEKREKKMKREREKREKKMKREILLVFGSWYEVFL